MKHYLESHKFYVIDADEKLVYKVGEFETYGNANFISVELELVAGWDYVDPDHNDVQGWVGADRFIEDIQYEYVTQYILEEGMKEAIKANGFTILEEITPSLQAIIDNHNDF